MTMKTEDCTACEGGYVNYQHPAKPLGVIMNRLPCQECNADGHIPDPWPKPTYYIVDAPAGPIKE